MERVAYIRSQIADISISSDVITGFPQESEEEFMEGYRNIEEMQLSFLHVFPYSKRDFTDAAKMPGHLDRKTKKARGAKLAQLSKELYTSYKQRFIGQKISVLFEKEVEGKGVPQMKKEEARPLNESEREELIRLRAENERY